MDEAFQLTMPVWEIVVRASVVYLAIVALVRVVPKRSAGSISPNDMLALVLIGAIAANGVMGGTHSVSNVLLMSAVVLGWGYLFDLLEYYFPAAHRFLRDDRTPLVYHGRLLRKNLRQEMITEEELMAVLRKEGVEDLTMVWHACLEADGQISVVKAGDRQTPAQGRQNQLEEQDTYCES